ncbi:MAG TPA: serine hydrolase domain-containing protein [Ottowia sp.]|uniref:serine hydrolase domain-containing protein n=1 Tax=Ottowia sp. TaxID=1898956 RepID=UPI002B90DDBB|nr:serine hydrolase domain-containing protein [Ottowia sp.]HPZ56152.1 serine hydrolase domain-containing protein [Ottowia sp.]
MKKTLYLIFTGIICSCSLTFAQNNPSANGSNVAPDEWLLVRKGSPWWYETKPSPMPSQLQKRPPSTAEQIIIDKARTLVANRPAKAFVLMDGDSVVYSETKAPADANSVFFGFSMGKTVTSMAVGQAICAGKMKLETKASEVVPELSGKALGNATVRDLLRMASGAADPNQDSSIWTPEQFKEWGRGNLNLVNLVTEDRIAKAARGMLSDYKPGEIISYKSTDPILLGIMVSRSTGTPWSQWLQEQVLNPMGAARSGLYVQDRQNNGLADGGMRLHLDDWMRFAVWVKRSSREQSCFGDYVRAALSTQISNGTSPNTRKMGKLFAGYGYFTWTENSIAPNTAWASGWGGQRIGWNTDPANNRMLITFSNIENWMPEVYEVARDWMRVK